MIVIQKVQGAPGESIFHGKFCGADFKSLPAEQQNQGAFTMCCHRNILEYNNILMVLYFLYMLIHELVRGCVLTKQLNNNAMSCQQALSYLCYSIIHIKVH